MEYGKFLTINYELVRLEAEAESVMCKVVLFCLSEYQD